MARSSSRPARRYPSKIDAWLAAIMVFAVLAMLSAPVLAWLETHNLRTLLVGLVVLPAAGLVIWIWLSTHYTLDGRELIVRSGPFRWRIDVDSITRVAPTRGAGVRIRSSRSSPALSIDRLEITYAGGRQLTVSPAEKDAFLNDLAARGAHL